MTDSLAIIQADLNNLEHGEALLSLLRVYAQDPSIGSPGMDEAEVENLLSALREFSTTVAFLAFMNETPVALALCFEGFSSFRAKPLLNIHDFAVHPGYQGRGIGKRLLQHVIDQAKQRGYCRVTLEVHEDNRRAKVLYERFGFEQKGLFLSRSI